MTPRKKKKTNVVVVVVVHPSPMVRESRLSQDGRA
jgi:hypothetical protein